MKIGSLFDGSGGFPLAGILCGIEPTWAAEVEPYPIAVTKSRFPNMKHLGSVTDVNGAEIDPVDVITFGSPCQDLSIAGKRAGLKHEENGDDETTRSGLFMEAVRIIKEMRKATNGMYPTFALWENVPGAFSSNRGEDFRVVLEELIKIIEPTATVPPADKNGWPYADCYVGDGWSLAYRVFDAQFWGVPQRRRRIYLVLDLRGERAEKVLFERKGLRGYFEESGTERKGASGNAESGSGADDRVKCLTPWDCQSKRIYDPSGTYCTLPAMEGSGRNNSAVLLFTQNQRDEVRDLGDKAGALQAQPGMKQQTFVAYPDVAQTLSARHDGSPQPDKGNGAGIVAYAVENHPADSRVDIDESGKVQTLTSRMGTGGGNVPLVMESVEDSVIDVEMEVAVRKYEVDAEKLKVVLREHRGDRTNKEIAELLNKPLTMVEHWFRADKYFAIPEPDVWHDLKKILNIETTEFDESIMTFEYKGGTYDMRNRIYIGETAPTLTCGCANHLHLLKQPIVYESHPMDSRIKETGEVSPTVSAKWHKGAADTPLVCEKKPVICIQGNGIDRQDHNGCAGRGYREDVSYTLNTIDRPAVAYAMQGFGDYKESDKASGLKARDYKDATDLVCGTANHHYIVRRLTPTECARLQGFPDTWGHPDHKEDFTDEEYLFWLDVRNTHATINGRATKEYTKAQMLTWYNKLHTDSSEYKMYGNGIALPVALYVMQGIKEAYDRGNENAKTQI